MPALATDCHLHVMGPFGDYPLDPARAYTPPEATLGAYLNVARTLGIRRHVVVQPSVFGFDNRCTLDAVERIGLAAARAVVVVSPDVDRATLRELHRRGARGVRLNFLFSPVAGVDEWRQVLPTFADLGWHVQVYAGSDVIIGLAGIARSIPVPLVLDHMGGVLAGQGSGDPAHDAAMRLVGEGHAYVKLCAYRSSRTGPPYADVAGIGRGFLKAAPERCLWGTDWPHPGLEDASDVPDDGRLTDVALDWLGDGAMAAKVLVDNPAALYGFTPRQ